MFRLLPTKKCKRQQIAILIISFFAYVAGIRNGNNNMLLQQQEQQQQQIQQQQQQHMTIENSNYKSPLISSQNVASDIKQQTISNFRPSPIIDFTTSDATVPQKFKPTYLDAKYPNSNAATFNTNTQYLQQKQQQHDDNRRYTATTNGNTAEKQFSFSNEQQQESLHQQQQQQQIPQQLTDRPIYIYRDPYTNENYHYTPTEPIIILQDTTTSPTPPQNHHNNYNNNGYKQQQQHHDDNQEYLVQSSMIVGTQQHQQHHQQQQQEQLLHPYMSLSADKDVYLKRPGLVIDEKTGYTHPNAVADKKIGEAQTLKANKISYDSHDYPPPSYFQQQTSNFLPTPVPEVVKPKPTPPPAAAPRPTPPPRPAYRPTSSSFSLSQLFGYPEQQQNLQSSQSTLPNYANNIDNYLSNKQQADYYRTESPVPPYSQHKQQYESKPPFSVQHQQQYESRPPPSYQQQHYDSRPPSSYQQQQYESRPPPPPYQQEQQQQYDSRPPPPPYQQQQQHYYSEPPSYNQGNPQQTYYPHYENTDPQQQAFSQPPPGRPSYNNYYDYQIGEVPPQAQTSSPSSQNFNYPYPRPPPSQYPYQGPYRPQPPPVPPTQQTQSGLATLAQYAPQFTQLFLGGGGGTSSNTNSPLGSLIGALTGATTSQQPSYSPSSSSSSYNRRPVNSQLIRALENIARNDDLQCVPKVLCQMIAAQTQRGQLPTFITSPAITNFLAGFPAASPAIIYGRAALLGLSGGEKICPQTYVKCPKNEFEIIDYLNNHRGGFFKFFSEPEEQQQNGNYDSAQQGGASSLFSILAALTGSPQVTTTTPRPRPKPQAPSADITSGIGNFFTQLLSDYMGGATVEYQRRRKRSLRDKIIFEDEKSGDIIKLIDDEEKDNSNDNKDNGNNEDNDIMDDEDFHDEEDTMDTLKGIEFRDDEEKEEDDEQEINFDNKFNIQGRILHKPGFRSKHIKFFPEMKETSIEDEKDQHLRTVIQKYNDFNKGRKLKFPTATDERQYLNVNSDAVRQGKELLDLPYEQQQNYGSQYTNYVEDAYDPLHRDSKKIKFQDDNAEQEQSLYSHYVEKPESTKTKVVFPERQGKILNNNYYAASYSYNDIQPQEEPGDKFVLPNSQRPSRYTDFPPTSSANVYNTHINSINSQNSFTSSSSINNNYYQPSSKPPTNSNGNHFLPTPPPDADHTSSNSIYSHNNYNSNQENYNSQYQSNYNKPQRYPASSISSSNTYKPQRYPASNSFSTNSNQYPSNTDRYHSSRYTTRRPYTTTTRKSDDKNIYVTNSRGVTEYYIRPDGRKVYL